MRALAKPNESAKIMIIIFNNNLVPEHSPFAIDWSNRHSRPPKKIYQLLSLLSLIKEEVLLILEK